MHNSSKKEDTLHDENFVSAMLQKVPQLPGFELCSNTLFNPCIKNEIEKKVLESKTSYHDQKKVFFTDYCIVEFLKRRQRAMTVNSFNCDQF